jgi:hypothetical protein
MFASVSNCNVIIDAMREYYRGVYSGMVSDTYEMNHLPERCMNWEYVQNMTDTYFIIFLKAITFQYMTSFSSFDDDIRKYIYHQVDHIANQCGAPQQAELVRGFFDTRHSVTQAFVVLYLRKLYNFFPYIWALLKMTGNMVIWNWFEAGRAIGIYDRSIYQG